MSKRGRGSDSGPDDTPTAAGRFGLPMARVGGVHAAFTTVSQCVQRAKFRDLFEEAPREVIETRAGGARDLVFEAAMKPLTAGVVDLERVTVLYMGAEWTQDLVADAVLVAVYNTTHIEKEFGDGVAAVFGVRLIKTK